MRMDKVTIQPSAHGCHSYGDRTMRGKHLIRLNMSKFFVRNLSIVFVKTAWRWLSLLIVLRRTSIFRQLKFIGWAYSVSAADIASIDFKRRRVRVVRYVLKCALRPRASLDWIKAVYESNVGRFIGKYPQLLLKPHRPYINRKFSFSQRARLVLDHYALALDKLPQYVFTGVICGKRFTISGLNGKPGTESYLVTVERANELGREGELCLSLRKESTDEAVYRLVFSLGQHYGQPSIYIGCLLGPRDYEAKTQIRCATKALNGIRPKNLLMDALYAFASELGIYRILGISSAERVSQGRAVRSSYDSFWKSLGGVPDSSGFFQLPSLSNHRNICDVSSHRRAEHKRRMELRKVLSSNLKQWITTRSEPAPSK